MVLTITRAGFLLALIVGGASLARLNEGFAELGHVGEVRFVGIFGTSVLVALAALAMRKVDWLGNETRWWIAGVLLLHLFIAMSWLWSDRTLFSDQQLYEIALLVASIWIAAWLFRSDPAASIRMLFLMFYGLAVAFLLAAMTLAGGLQGEIAAIGAGGIGASRVLGMGVIAAAFFTMSTGNGYWLVPVPLMVGGMLLTGSRAAVLALLATVLVLWWKRRLIAPPQRRHARIGSRFLRSIAALVLLVGFFITPFGQPLLVSFVQSTVRGEAGSGETQLYLADRDIIFTDALETLTAHPAGGLGLGSYVGPFGELYPHNLLLGFGVDAGVIPAVLCAVLLAVAFLKLVRKTTRLAQAALSGATFFAVSSMFAGTYYDSRFVWLFLVMGLVLVDQERARRAAGALGGALGTFVLAAPAHSGHQ